MVDFSLRRLSPALGAEVCGLDLRQPLHTGLIEQIRSAWMEHQVLVFRDQHIGIEEQVRLSEAFGQVDDYPLVHLRHPDNPKIMLLSSEPGKGKKATTRGSGKVWHTDLSFTTRPAIGSMLHAQKLPRLGGDTLFANQYLAFDTLSPNLQQTLMGMESVHELFSSRTDLHTMDTAKMLEMRAANPPVVHPAVRTHPETRRPALYVSPAASVRMLGWTVEESAGLLEFLKCHAVRQEFIYRHSWRPNDLMMWDNRCLLHLAVQDYDYEEHRLMYRTTITGPEIGRLVEDASEVGPTLLQQLLANS